MTIASRGPARRLKRVLSEGRDAIEAAARRGSQELSQVVDPVGNAILAAVEEMAAIGSRAEAQEHVEFARARTAAARAGEGPGAYWNMLLDLVLEEASGGRPPPAPAEGLCPECGYRIPPQARFCTYCRAHVESTIARRRFDVEAARRRGASGRRPAPAKVERDLRDFRECDGCGRSVAAALARCPFCRAEPGDA